MVTATRLHRSIAAWTCERISKRKSTVVKDFIMKRISAVKIFVFLACLLPLGRLAWKAFNAGLGANPIEVITRSTGTWTLTFLVITLAITPVRRISGWLSLIKFRRMLGLFAFFYGVLHFLTYIWLDKFFDLHEMVNDIGKRPFITV